MRQEVWPTTRCLMKDDTKLLPKVIDYIAYMEKNYVPTTVPIRKKSVLFNPDWTCLYDNDDGIVTNNYSESNNARLKRKLGLHPSLFKFLSAMKEETAPMEVLWLQRNANGSVCHYAALTQIVS